MKRCLGYEWNYWVGYETGSIDMTAQLGLPL